MGVVVRRYIDILTIIINFFSGPTAVSYLLTLIYNTCKSDPFSSATCSVLTGSR